MIISGSFFIFGEEDKETLALKHQEQYRSFRWSNEDVRANAPLILCVVSCYEDVRANAPTFIAEHP